MPSQATTFFETVYTSLTEGGVGLIGVSGNSPSLRATIDGIKFLSDQKDLGAIIAPLALTSGSTFSTEFDTFYSALAFGGIGLTNAVHNPDLRAAYGAEIPGNSGTLDLSAIIRPIQSGQLDLGAFWRSAASGSQDLNAVYSGFSFADLGGYIRPTISASADLPAFIEPIPPLDLDAIVQGVVAVDLGAEIEPIAPADLPATISGQPFLDLLATLSGADSLDLGATVSGNFVSDIGGIIIPVESGTAQLSGSIHGFLGIGVSGDLYGYIVATSSGSLDLPATITGLSFKDLNATVLGLTYDDLSGTYSGSLPPDSLEATINPTGSLLDLSAYINPSRQDTGLLYADIDGQDVLDLIAEINTDPQELLYAEITSTGVYSQYLQALVTGVVSVELSGSYTSVVGSPLEAEITPTPGADLSAVITPKVFYIDSSIPINTYAVSQLKAVINADNCGFKSDFSDLQVIISGTPSSDLYAELIGLAGQYAISTDEISLNLKTGVISEDWVFFISKSLVLSEDLISLVITNSPLADLSATIVGVQAHEDLSAQISSVYIPSVSRTGVPLGQWVNLKTGETKLLRLFFKGSAVDFYYSSSGNTTYNANPSDLLQIVVESYKRLNEGQDTSLLNIKTEVKQCVVDNLQGFASIDAAIKYAIACSVSEIAGTLSANIVGVGEISDLGATVSGLDTDYISTLGADYIPVANDPILMAEVTPTGSLGDLQAILQPAQAQVTSTPFYDIDGNRFLPTLQVLENGDYSVTLTPISPFDSIEVISPDLQVTITGLGAFDLGATVSGM